MSQNEKSVEDLVLEVRQLREEFEFANARTIAAARALLQPHMAIGASPQGAAAQPAPRAIEPAAREVQRLRELLIESERRRALLWAEVLETYPIAATASAFMNDEASIDDLRAVADLVSAKRGSGLAHHLLPPRLQELGGGINTEDPSRG